MINTLPGQGYIVTVTATGVNQLFGCKVMQDVSTGRSFEALAVYSAGPSCNLFLNLRLI
jgi:hypothetical protein